MKLLSLSLRGRTTSRGKRTAPVWAELLERRVLFNQVTVALTPGSSLQVVSNQELDRIRTPNFAALVTLSGPNIQDTTPRPNQHVITGNTTSIDSVSITSGSGANVAFLLDGKGPLQMGDFSSAVPLNAVSLKPTTLVGTFAAPVTKLDLGQTNGATIHVTTTGKPVSFTSGVLTDTKLTFDNSLRLFQSGAFTSTVNNASTLRAPFVDLMKINGDLWSNITLTGGARLALGNAIINGSMTGGFVSVTGNMGHFGGNNFNLTKGRITVSGNIDGVAGNTFSPQGRITATGQVGMLKAVGNFGGTYQFGSLKTFSVGGNVDSLFLQLNLPFSTNTFNLNTATVRGSMSNSSIISNGSMKRLSFGQIGNSLVWAGINPAALTTGATSPTDIVNPARIDSFFTHNYSGTNLAGGRLGSLNLGVVNPNNGGTTFGLTAELIQSVQAQFGTKKLTLKNVLNNAALQAQLQKLGFTQQDVGDFRVLLTQ